jgi:hypothetical protein
MHEHSFSSIISKFYSNCHHVRLRFYALGSGVCFLPTQSSHFLRWPLTFSLHYALDIIAMSGYCAYNKWYSHFGRCGHCWLDLCRSCFMSHLFPGNGYDDCSLSKGCVILQPTPWRSFHPSSNRNIWVFTPIGEWLPSSLCQHGMVSKGLEWSSSFDYTFIL